MFFGQTLYCRSGGAHSLLRGLLQILLGLIQFLLQQLHLPRQILPHRPMGITLVSGAL